MSAVAEDRTGTAVKGLFGHDSLYMALWATQLVLASLLTPVTTRLLGARGFGSVAAAIAVLQVMVALGGFSLFTAVQRAYARPGGEETARRIVTLAISVALVVFALSYATGELWTPLVGLGRFPVAIRYTLAWAALTAITNAGLSYLRSCDRLASFAAVSLTQSIVAEAFALGLVVLVRHSANEYLLGQMLVQGLAVGLVIFLVKPRRLVTSDARLIRETLRYSAALVPAVLSTFVLDASDRLVVHADLGAAAVARYVVARNIGGFMIILLAVLNAIWMPRLFAIEDRDEQREVLAASRDGIYGLVLSAMLILCMASPLLLWIWVPPSYRPGGLLLVTALVAAASVPMAGAQSQTQVLLVGERTTPVAIGTMVAGTLNLGLNLVLVPVLGIDGSALITLCCYGIQLAILQRFAMRTIRLRAPSPRLIALIVVAIAIALGSTALPTDGGGIAIRVLFALAAAALFVVQLVAAVRPGRSARIDQLAGWLAMRPHAVSPVPAAPTITARSTLTIKDASVMMTTLSSAPPQPPTTDLELFAHIESETSDGDRRALLALREVVAGGGDFAYLEIGSHLGGTLQPFIVDARCREILSIDARPVAQPDNRFEHDYAYAGNSTQRMRDLLSEIPDADLDKLTTIDAGTQAIDPAAITIRPSLCFIDGEHTDAAALRDALFCMEVAPEALIVFHDRNVVGRAISAFMRISGGYGHQLPDTLFAVDLSGRGRLDHYLRRPRFWRAANVAHLSGERAALNSAMYLALARRPAAHRAFGRLQRAASTLT